MPWDAEGFSFLEPRASVWFLICEIFLYASSRTDEGHDALNLDAPDGGLKAEDDER
jgi:hypothetical protein